MSLFEWLGENFNPGRVGDIDAMGAPLVVQKIKRIWVILMVVLGLLFLALAFWAIKETSGSNRWALIIGLIIYLVIAFFITPEPDTKNLGLLGGLIDHPFRISDDFNRFLLFFYILLLPGKLIIFSFQAIYKLLKYNR